MLERLGKIKALVSDVDGVMTNGQIWLDSNNEWKRAWSVLDGSGLRQIMEIGYKVGVITAATAQDVSFRMNFLGIHYFYNGTRDKYPAFEDILKKSGLRPDEIAYIGDDIYDVPVLKAVGFAVAPPTALEEAKSAAHYITQKAAGFGAVREICDLLRAHGSIRG
jgi:3-deoxy-D-manno-octulosonate 8-phosphate phosphatase (KDO 8-P phosphatase)